MSSKKVTALTASLAGIVTCSLALIFRPISYFTSKIKNENTRTNVCIGLLFMFTGCLFFFTVFEFSKHELGQALKSTNVNIAINDEGEDFIQSLPLLTFSFGLMALIGSLSWTAFCRPNSLFAVPLISPTKALNTIDKYDLMKGFRSAHKMTWRDVQLLKDLTNGQMLELAKPFRHPDECLVDTSIIYILCLTPLLALAYLAPVIAGQNPSIYWMDHLGGYLADAASKVIELIAGKHYNLRNTIWSLPVMLSYYGILGTILFRYASVAYNTLLIFQIEERHQCASSSD